MRLPCRIIVFVVLACSCSGSSFVYPKQFPVCSKESPQVEAQVFPFEGQFPMDSTARVLFIHYDSSTLCSVCLLKQYYLWDDLIDRLGEEGLDYCFILEPGQEISDEVVISALEDACFSRPVYLDREKLFQEELGIKSKSGSEDILIDSSGQVLLVGDLRHDARFFEKIERQVKKGRSLD